jgi:hypothetical protein
MLPPPASPEPEILDTATTPDLPYSWTRIPRVSGTSRIERELTTSYNPAPLALLLLPLLRKLSWLSKIVVLPMKWPLLLAFLKSLYTPRLSVLPLIPLIILIGGKLYALSLQIVRLIRFGLLLRNPMYRKEGR